VSAFLARIRRRASRMGRDESGYSTVEFVIIFPLFLAMFLASFESGYMMLRNVMLERSVDLAVRDLRLGDPTPPTVDQFRQEICDNAYYIGDCNNRVMVELRPINPTTWGPLPGPATCTNIADPTSIQPPTYLTGGNNELMIVRVCALVEPIFPTTGLGLALRRVPDRPEYALIVTTAYVNEPSR